jgi:tRNA pseudouridine55 synthase
MDGLILIDKPSGWTSFDAVNKVRHLAEGMRADTGGRKRFPVGHTGTLDPLATGLLVLLLGKYTRRATELTKLDKAYEVTMQLGSTSTTGDEEGQKMVRSTHQPTRQEVTSALRTFTGQLQQVPPAFSAIKVQGKRAYLLARNGQKPELQPRSVEVYSLTLTDYAYPYVRFTAHVSSGTYIRSLVEDMGESLKTGAYMSGLRRTKVGPFDVADAVSAALITPELLYDRIHQDQFPTISIPPLA